MAKTKEELAANFNSDLGKVVGAFAATVAGKQLSRSNNAAVSAAGTLLYVGGMAYMVCSTIKNVTEICCNKQ